MKKITWIMLIILAFIVGFILGFVVVSNAFSRIAYEILSQYGYNPDIIIKECFARVGLG